MVNGTVPVYVVRHGATKMNNDTDLSEDRIRGWANVPLSDEGREEAHKAAAKLQQFGIQVIVTSDLTRALETAQIIGQTLGVQAQPSQKLRPWNLGDFTGQSTKDALPKIAAYAQNQPDQPVPGGESFNQFKARAFQGLAEAMQMAGGRPLCIVTHHRDERLFKASEVLGWPPNHEIDLNTFLQKGDPPGGVYEMNVNPTALAPQGGGNLPQAMPPGAPQQPGGAGLPVPAGGQPPQPGMPPGGQPPQPDPMFAAMMQVQQKLQQITKAIQLLREDTASGYRIDIEVDTMVAGDQMQERQDASEFLKAVTEFVTAAGQITMANPEFAPLAGKMLQFGVRKFRTGRELESAIDEYVDKITKNPPKPQQNPQHQKAQADAQVAQMKAQAEIAKSKLDAQSAQANDQREQQRQTLDFQQKQKMMSFEMQMKEKEFQMRMAEMDREAQFKAADHQRKMAEAHMQHQQHMQAAMMPKPAANGGMQQ